MLLPDSTVVPSPDSSTDMPSHSKKDYNLRRAFWLSMFINLALVATILIGSGNNTKSYNRGYYAGQTDLCRWLQDWKYGKLVFLEGMAVFTFDGKTSSIYFYNRNKYPDTTKYPSGREPTSDQPAAPRNQ